MSKTCEGGWAFKEEKPQREVTESKTKKKNKKDVETD